MATSAFGTTVLSPGEVFPKRRGKPLHLPVGRGPLSKILHSVRDILQNFSVHPVFFTTPLARRHKDAPRCTNRQRSPQDVPKTPQDVPKTAQDRSKTHQHCRQDTLNMATRSPNAPQNLTNSLKSFPDSAGRLPNRSQNSKKQ